MPAPQRDHRSASPRPATPACVWSEKVGKTRTTASIHSGARLPPRCSLAAQKQMNGLGAYPTVGCPCFASLAAITSSVLGDIRGVTVQSLYRRLCVRGHCGLACHNLARYRRRTDNHETTFGKLVIYSRLAHETGQPVILGSARFDWSIT
jgi:hypothetical protein